MAGYRAISNVSGLIKSLLKDNMQDAVSVTIAPPDVQIGSVTGKRVNLYLYHVSENAALKNADIPGLGHPGAFGNPPLSLILHYLLTCYPENESTEDGDLEAQEVLGDAIRVLHDFSIIPRDLLDPNMKKDFEQVKITLYPLTLEDLSKVWTALPKANFRRSVAYEVSTVQIESRRPRRASKQVDIRRIHMSQLRHPEITAVYRTPVLGEPASDQRVQIMGSLTIEGINIYGEKMWVKFGEQEPIRVTPGSDGKIQITAPDAKYPIDADHPTERDIPEASRLYAGPQTVQVLVEQDTEVVEGGLETSGTYNTDKRVMSSNRAVFMLIPKITNVPVNSGPASTAVIITGSRLYREGLRSLVLFNDITIEATNGGQSDTQIQVSLLDPKTLKPLLQPNIKYAVRVMVNGAQNMEQDFFFTMTP
jgi:hypothetical protein